MVCLRVNGQTALGFEELLGGSWDLLTTYNWAYDPTYTRANPHKALEGYYKWGY